MCATASGMFSETWYVYEKWPVAQALCYKIGLC